MRWLSCLFIGSLKYRSPTLGRIQHFTLESYDASFGPKIINTRFRQHVNPLSREYQVPIVVNDSLVRNSFAQFLDRPLVLDVGCARGTWALEYGQEHPAVNILGLEIRKNVVDYCIKRKLQRQLSNVHFIYANANVDLKNLLIYLNGYSIELKCVAIQFADPNFKKKHKKRRVVNDALLNDLSQHLKPGTALYIQTDIETLALDTCEIISRCKYFSIQEGYSMADLTKNEPLFTVKTEREVATIAKGQPIYRICYVRNDVDYIMAEPTAATVNMNDNRNDDDDEQEDDEEDSDNDNSNSRSNS